MVSLGVNFAGKFKTQSVFNTSSTRKQVHHKTPENALACASSLYYCNFKTGASSLYIVSIPLLNCGMNLLNKPNGFSLGLIN